jgi:hypothetical protein
VDWIQLVQDKVWWCAVVTTVINFRALIEGEEFHDWLSEQSLRGCALRKSDRELANVCWNETEARLDKPNSTGTIHLIVSF